MGPVSFSSGLQINRIPLLLQDTSPLFLVPEFHM